MRVVSKAAINRFCEKNFLASQALNAWFKTAEKAEWATFADVKTQFPSCDFISPDRLVFNVKGNTYRVVTVVDFKYHGLLIRFIGSHAEYDRIDVRTI